MDICINNSQAIQALIFVLKEAATKNLKAKCMHITFSFEK